ncbi:50S ribosomal protein L25/general stress protein Ctc [Rothia amarae]|uniref:Large ribosomal subunit protein bL25 n=1 Tax=Rothia amarae TaxID=169480 RepID=A0A7H2BIE7_9MICC|nr:50S ribosomal protein L25/general stress protein Ctc [Rothia amarae]QNV39443.1 50S ribosomal protein L25/general stress protein Ctc [Rothia amarae]
MADTTKLAATLREDFGKGYARRIRMAGDIPAVIYGHGEEPKHVVLPGHATTLAARNANAILDLDIEGDSTLVMIKDIQRHSIRPEIQHMDLILVKRGERVEVEVPLTVQGEVAEEAIANQEETVLLVEVDALKVPEEIVVDIEGRNIGEHVLAGDIKLPSGVTLVADEELLVVNVSEPQELDVPEPGEEGETDAEGNPIELDEDGNPIEPEAPEGDVVEASEESDQAGEAHDSDNSQD